MYCKDIIVTNNQNYSSFSRDPESMAGSDSDTESIMSSVSGFGRKKKKR